MMLTPDVASTLTALFEAMEEKLLASVGGRRDGVQLRRSFDGRLMGQTWETPFVDMPEGPIDAAAITGMIERFHAEYHRRNGLSFPHIPVQGVSYRVQVVVTSEKLRFPRLPEVDDPRPPPPLGHRTLRELSPQPVEAALYERTQLPRGCCIRGPAIIQEALCTTLVGPGQQATVGALGELYIEKTTTEAA
jgi:N-methylhydantoinase A